MANVVWFHSVLGRRPVELAAADRLRDAGHRVWTPDLYEGATATTLDDGFAIMDDVTWDVLEARARAFLDDLPEDAVLGGFSMGSVVAQTMAPHRPGAAALVMLHGLVDPPPGSRADLPTQLHVADPDSFAPPAAVERLRAVGDPQVFTYPGAGHFYTDESLPDHDADATALTWQRVLEFLAAVARL